MLLSQEINELREDVNKIISFSNEVHYGFNKCVKHAQELEVESIDLKKAIELMKWFCDRVENGEVRSVNTYSEFKRFINGSR